MSKWVDRQKGGQRQWRQAGCLPTHLMILASFPRPPLDPPCLVGKWASLALLCPDREEEGDERDAGGQEAVPTAHGWSRVLGQAGHSILPGPFTLYQLLPFSSSLHPQWIE